MGCLELRWFDGQLLFRADDHAVGMGRVVPATIIRYLYRYGFPTWALMLPPLGAVISRRELYSCRICRAPWPSVKVATASTTHLPR